jgi:hypothetical protein
MRNILFSALLASFVISAQARVVSYAPYSDRASYPALQHRLNRHVVVVEGESPTNGGILILPPIVYYGAPAGQVVVYDTKGFEEPRVVFPAADRLANISAAAVRENGAGVPTILIQTTDKFDGSNAAGQPIWLLSIDGGSNWNRLALPVTGMSSQLVNAVNDIGGPFARRRQANIAVGTIDTPFIIGTSTQSGGAVYAIGRDATVKTLATMPEGAFVVGANSDGTRFVIRSGGTISLMDLAGNRAAISNIATTDLLDAWITPSGTTVYALEYRGYSSPSLWLYANGTRTFIAGAPGTTAGNPMVADTSAFFAVPTSTFDGAWMIQRGTGKPTTLLLHTPASGLTTQWSDVTGPEVEALHAGASGKTLLVQVHRPRVSADQRLFKDPALAVWHVGDPLPPAGYDELYLAEQTNKGFVHVDVDAIESGDPFVFDSGPIEGNSGGGIIISPPPPSSGGSDVVQEWGVVKGSLAQRLVIPGVARTPGAFGSYWMTDVIFRNPGDLPVTFAVRYASTGSVTASDATERTVTLHGREIALVPDILKTLFGAEVGGGALFLTPPIGSAIEATARTYSTTAAGSFGFGMNAVDVNAAGSPRFPLSFAGAFPGANFRTNLIVTDVSGRGTESNAIAAGTSGVTGNSNVFFGAAANGMQQITGIATALGLAPSESGALLLQPTRGETVAAALAIDNRTNDPTYFPPDLPAAMLRTIPAIGHLDGANGSRFRSDLYLYNPSKQPRNVTLQCTPWDPSDPPKTLTLLLLANEGRIIRDVVASAFGKSGIVRLRYQSSGDPGVRVTARTYTLNDDGGTYGLLAPPLNSFQSASAGDTLEILGALVDKRFRTNLGVVDLAAFAGNRPTRFRVEIVSSTGATLDSFETSVGSASGMQLNDLFTARNTQASGPVLLRVSPIDGQIGAFATLVDNGTNDPLYLAANLAAHQ